MLIISLSGVFIDIDHIFYQYFFTKNKSIKKMWKWHNKENAIHRPHFYIFHIIEFLVLFFIFSFFLNRIMFLISIGFVLHFFIDAIMYTKYHKSLSWLKEFSIIYLIKKKYNY